MCFLMDRTLGKSVCYIQFRKRFDGIGKNDRYANRNTDFFVTVLTDVQAFLCLQAIQIFTHRFAGCLVLEFTLKLAWK